MAFRIREGENVREAIQRIAREQIDAALAEMGDEALPQAEKIHQVRKRCKKLRAVVRLVRPVVGEQYVLENACYRDAARLLSGPRDAQSMLDAHDGLVARFEGEVMRRTFGPLRRRLVCRSGDARQEADLAERLHQVRGLLRDGRERVAVWSIEAGGAEAWRGGFERTYRQARRAMAAAYDSGAATDFHEWRKGAKYHWYHTRLLRPLWDGVLRARAREAAALGEMLGAHHDLMVLRATLLQDEADGRRGDNPIAPLIPLIDRRRSELEAAAKPVGARLFAEKPGRVGNRHARYWEAWQEERRTTADAPLATSA
jgi:CHAD domain-containing protein